jgi:hypothetical protein
MEALMEVLGGNSRKFFKEKSVKTDAIVQSRNKQCIKLYDDLFVGDNIMVCFGKHKLKGTVISKLEHMFVVQGNYKESFLFKDLLDKTITIQGVES